MGKKAPKCKKGDAEDPNLIVTGASGTQYTREQVLKLTAKELTEENGKDGNCKFFVIPEYKDKSFGSGLLSATV